MQVASERPSLFRLFLRFLRFGALAWGGPVAQIAMIKRELVEGERWIDQSRFNRLLAVYQVLPGPEAHELCVHFGMMRRGRIGGLVAGLGFMLPGFVLMLLLAWAYAQLDLTEPVLAAAFLGIQIGVIALIARAVYRIGEHVLIDRWLWTIAAATAAASVAGVPFWITLPVAGIAYSLAAAGRHVAGVAAMLAAAALAYLLGPWTHDSMASTAAAVAAAGSVGALPLFVTGLKGGLLTFGGAYTAIPFIRDDAVGRGWISDGQFLDGVALAGIIPAPLVIFATFVGYQAGGLAGALAITAGMFLPAFAFTMIFYDRLERVIENAQLHRFLEGVAGGVVGLIALTTAELGAHVALAVPAIAVTALIFAAALFLLYRWQSKLVPLGVVALSGAAGMLLLR